jgi:hypothetical protein
MAEVRREPVLVPVEFDEDHQTWEHYKAYPEFRWLFNKLEVALRQGLHAGPAGTAPQANGIYISRPIYNTYGMGIGAKKFIYDKSMSEDLIDHAVVPPGHFWCQWVPGPQLSIDYQVHDDYKTWTVNSIWSGEHYSSDNLTKFKQWTKLDPSLAPNVYTLPLKFPWFGPDATRKTRELVSGFNVEIRSGKIIEVHLRHGNDTLDHLPVGTVVTPVWEDMEIPEGAEFEPNLTEGMTNNGAHGQLSNIRRGFLVTRPN